MKHILKIFTFISLLISSPGCKTENYFPKSQPSSDGAIDDEDGSTAQDVDTTDAMKTYMSAISRNQKASA